MELKNYLSHLKVNLVVAAYTHCPVYWRDIDYIPDYNKFYFICDGEGWLKIGEQEFYPKPGQLFFMPAGIKQSYSTISDDTFTKYWCHFTAKIGDVNIYNFIKFPFFIDVVNKKEITNLFLKLISYYDSKELTSPLYAQAILIELFALSKTIVCLSCCNPRLISLSRILLITVLNTFESFIFPS
jgi:AraC family transcriptional regulator of arabinose operon